MRLQPQTHGLFATQCKQGGATPAGNLFRGHVYLTHLLRTHWRALTRRAAPARRELVAADSRGNVAAFAPNATELWERHVGSNVAQARPPRRLGASWLQPRTAPCWFVGMGHRLP